MNVVCEASAGEAYNMGGAGGRRGKGKQYDYILIAKMFKHDLPF